MKKWIAIHQRGDFFLFVFHVCLILFIWPFLAPNLLHRPGSLFAYLFLAWAVVILALYLISRLGAPAAGRKEDMEARR